MWAVEMSPVSVKPHERLPCCCAISCPAGCLGREAAHCPCCHGAEKPWHPLTPSMGGETHSSGAKTGIPSKWQNVKPMLF